MAEQVGCTHAYVDGIRKQVASSSHLPDRVTGKDGKSYPASRTSAAPMRCELRFHGESYGWEAQFLVPAGPGRGKKGKRRDLLVPAVSDVPTFKELGIDKKMANERGELLISRGGFVLRELAVQWAEHEREAMEKTK